VYLSVLLRQDAIIGLSWNTAG